MKINTKSMRGPDPITPTLPPEDEPGDGKPPVEDPAHPIKP